VSVAPPEAAPWPFLVVLLERPPDVKGDGAAELRVRGLGWILGDYVATLAHVGARADVLVTADDGPELPVVPLGRDETFALLRFGEEATAGRAPSLGEATNGAECSIAMVRDDMPQVRLVSGQVDKLEADGRFTVALDGRLPEDRTASGSPVVSDDGAVIGIVGPTASSSSVDAFGLGELQRLVSASEGASEAPSPAISAATRSALGYALALASGAPLAPVVGAFGPRGVPIGPAAAVLLGVLRSAVGEPGQTVAGDLLAFISAHRQSSAQVPASRLVDAAVAALGLSAPAYPPDPPPEDATLQASVLAPVLQVADGYRTRIEPAGRLQRRFLLAAVLTQPVTDFPLPLFDSLGITLLELRDAFRESIASRPDEPVELWDQALAEPPQVPFELAGGISADLVDPTRGIPLKRDSLGVHDYVTMFANVIADKDTPMPLSFGLFGEWGSGKTTFMGLLYRQVETLAASYRTDIVQITFNAWHYADSNLWASLGDEIFTQLAGPGETNEQRRSRLRQQLGEKLQRRKELEAAAEQAQREIARLSAELDEAAINRDSSARELMTAVIRTTEFRSQLQSAWKRIGIDDEVEQARLLVDELNQAPTDIAVVRRALGAPRRWFPLLVLVLAAATVVALGALASREWLTGAGLVAMSSVVVVAGWLIARVSSGARLLHQAADNIRRQEAEKTAAERQGLRRAEAEQEVLQKQLDRISDEVGELGRQLAELSPGQRLYRFISERAASETYRGQLGLISTIRKDFEQLVQLMNDWKQGKTADGSRPPRPIDRIVLYIDDLDRCSPEQVVDVLQAVHLLLALELFVVVVGVDPRWLVRALRHQYRSMLTTGSQPTGQDPWWVTTPQDYLEKIFNIPFVLPRMSPGGFQQLVRSLAALEPEEDTEPAGDGEEAPARGGEPAQPEPVHEQESVTADTGVDAEAPIVQTADLPVEAESKVAALQSSAAQTDVRPLTDPELALLTALAPLIDTPRETTRLLNLYRLIRSTRNLSPAARFLGNDETPGEYQAVVILLGLLSGHAQLLENVLAAPRRRGVKGGLRGRVEHERWGDFVAGMRPRKASSGWRNDIVGAVADGDEDGWKRLADGLVGASALVTIPDLAPFQLWAPRIARFSFLLSPYAQGEVLQVVEP
jgi:hypothetical protein